MLLKLYTFYPLNIFPYLLSMDVVCYFITDTCRVRLRTNFVLYLSFLFCIIVPIYGNFFFQFLSFHCVTVRL